MDRRRLLKGLAAALLAPALAAGAAEGRVVGYFAPGFVQPGVAVVRWEGPRGQAIELRRLEIRECPLEWWAAHLAGLQSGVRQGEDRFLGSLEWRVDRSEPRAIEYLRRCGLNAVPWRVG